MPTPPVSPTHTTAELEVSHVESILEYACDSKEIDNEAVINLCALVKADPQEQEVVDIRPVCIMQHITRTQLYIFP